MDDDAIRSLLTAGGDARIVANEATGVNRYFASPFPRDTVTYASSTANDITADAFAYLKEYAAQHRFDEGAAGASYSDALEELRNRIRSAFRIEPAHDIVFAPSGTDLEYVAILVARGRAPNGVHNILLGADEVGSGCIFSAHGRYFAHETALGLASVPNEPVVGLGPVSLHEIPVRDRIGVAFDSHTITKAIEHQVEAALAVGRHPLVHVVHGSKTGLILPHIEEIDDLIARYGDRLTLVVDACQARITCDAIEAYLSRNAVVLLTGSKFMGGPPFSGFAIIPRMLVDGAQALPQDMKRIFRRAEFLHGWRGREQLADSANQGLCARLVAAVFELERFQALPLTKVERIIGQFYDAACRLVRSVQGREVEPYAEGEGKEAATHPIEMRTLVTIDLAGEGKHKLDFAYAGAIQRAMIDNGVRLGQPVKCAMLDPDDAQGIYRGTLRIGISMPQISQLAELSSAECQASLDADMVAVFDAYLSASAKVMMKS